MMSGNGLSASLPRLLNMRTHPSLPIRLICSMRKISLIFCVGAICRSGEPLSERWNRAATIYRVASSMMACRYALRAVLPPQRTFGPCRKSPLQRSPKYGYSNDRTGSCGCSGQRPSACEAVKRYSALRLGFLPFQSPSRRNSTRSLLTVRSGCVLRKSVSASAIASVTDVVP